MTKDTHFVIRVEVRLVRVSLLGFIVFPFIVNKQVVQLPITLVCVFVALRELFLTGIMPKGYKVPSVLFKVSAPNIVRIVVDPFKKPFPIFQLLWGEREAIIKPLIKQKFPNPILYAKIIYNPGVKVTRYNMQVMLPVFRCQTVHLRVEMVRFVSVCLLPRS